MRITKAELIAENQRLSEENERLDSELEELQFAYNELENSFIKFKDTLLGKNDILKLKTILFEARANYNNNRTFNCNFAIRNNEEFKDDVMKLIDFLIDNIQNSDE